MRIFNIHSPWRGKELKVKTISVLLFQYTGGALQRVYLLGDKAVIVQTQGDSEETAWAEVDCCHHPDIPSPRDSLFSFNVLNSLWQNSSTVLKGMGWQCPFMSPWCPKGMLAISSINPSCERQDGVQQAGCWRSLRVAACGTA